MARSTGPFRRLRESVRSRSSRARPSRILCVGGINLDEAIRLESPLQAGEGVVGASLGLRPGGGAAIAAAALAQAGCRVTVAGVVGDDAHGAMLREVLAARGIDVSAIETKPGPTTRVLVLIDPSGERTIIAVGGYRATELEGAGLLGGDYDAVLTKLHAPIVPKIVAAHWAKGALTVAVLARHGRAPLAARVLIASEHDLEGRERDDPLTLGRTLCGAALEWVVVTRGANGAEAFGIDGSRHRVPAVAAQVVDTTGAGDVFAAGLTEGLLRTGDIDKALARGAEWAAKHVATEGSLPPENLALPPP
ncbi:MAG: carbohydrate kinase family protein [Elioraea sp.]|nr:carbohydrate kinase family protein [Elioraea sp.]MDW8443223.1 carbohydrate kinase family protein [Acetobacteraceae bacterium]